MILIKHPDQHASEMLLLRGRSPPLEDLAGEECARAVACPVALATLRAASLGDEQLSEAATGCWSSQDLQLAVRGLA